MIAPYHQSILIVDDHRLFAEGIRSLLISCGYTTVDVFTASNDLLNKITAYNPALLLLDITMDDIDGIALSALIRNNHPAIKILIISMHARRIYIEKALQAGVHGYLIKNASDEELKLAVASILAGERFYSSEIKDVLVNSLLPSPDSNGVTFTKREKDILLLMSEGYSSKEIADRLFVSINTIETHRKNMFFKTGLRNMAHLIKWAFENGQI
jgi:DNA-binding NarL/FixJ family response regulator